MGRGGMRADFDILEALIRDEALASVEHSYGKKALVLTESGNTPGSGYSLTVRDVPDDAIALKADAFPAPISIFRGDNGECKRADFVIIASDGGSKWVVYIEMKKGGGRTELEIVRQLRGAECLIAYCRAIGQKFWQAHNFLDNSYRPCFVSVRDIGAQKRPSFPQRSARHDAPERMLKIKAPPNSTVRFKQLV